MEELLSDRETEMFAIEEGIRRMDQMLFEASTVPTQVLADGFLLKLGWCKEQGRRVFIFQQARRIARELQMNNADPQHVLAFFE